MSFDGRHLLDLLPSLYRLRDFEVASQTGGLLGAIEEAELNGLEATLATLDAAALARLDALRDRSRRGPLSALLTVLGDEFAVVEESLAQLYDDEFVETAAGWVLPYIGDLIGYRSLHGRAPGQSGRAELGHTIAFRRRKGTASMLEQLARDVTGWNAHVVESFRLLGTTQFMNHVRLDNLVTPAIRNGAALELVGTAFDPIPRTLDVRRIGHGGGRHNISNIAIFLWRIDAQGVHRSPATADPTDASGRRFRFSPLGDDVELWTRPVREDEIEHLAEPINVPFPISRRRLAHDLGNARPDLYGDQRSLAVFVGGGAQPAAVTVCNLADDGAGGWAHDAAAGTVAIDPVLGRLVVAADIPLAGPPAVSFYRGGPEAIGGGEYERASSFATDVAGPTVHVPDDQATIQGAIDALVAAGGSGIVEIRDAGRYRETLSVVLPADGAIEIRALNEVRPTIELVGPWTIRGGIRSRVFLNGLLVAGERLAIGGAGNRLTELHITHTTLVPGHTLDAKGQPAQPGDPSLTVTLRDVRVEVRASISGPLRINARSALSIDDSIIDAGRDGVAFGASLATPTDPGGDLDVESSTLIGETHTHRLCASNAILFGLVTAVRTQDGCVRFSYLPAGSRAPRRYRCQPGEGSAAINVPHFVSLLFHEPAYARLAAGTPEGIARGAEDESEMGVYRRRYEPQRHADLDTRLDEYLRVGLEAGVIHES